MLFDTHFDEKQFVRPLTRGQKSLKILHVAAKIVTTHNPTDINMNW
mgnify:CR=1 FL=1